MKPGTAFVPRHTRVPTPVDGTGRMALPRRVNIISYNMWLIPTYGAWNLGRIDRCRDRVANEMAKLLAAAPCDLSIVALHCIARARYL